LQLGADLTLPLPTDWKHAYTSKQGKEAREIADIGQCDLFFMAETASLPIGPVWANILLQYVDCGIILYGVRVLEALKILEVATQ
jgi:hypothetical protein